MIESSEDGTLEYLLSVTKFLYIKLRKVDDGTRIVCPCIKILILASAYMQDVQRGYRISNLRNVFVPLAKILRPYLRILTEELYITAM